MFNHTPRWVDRHLVNCIMCNKLFDEREGMCTDSEEGTYCSECWDNIHEAAPDMYTFIKAQPCECWEFEKRNDYESRCARCTAIAKAEGGIRQ